MAFLPIYVLILLITIVVDYYAGICIENSKGRNRKLFLILSLIANIGFLCFFKYYDFFVININSLLSVHLPLLKELGISNWIIRYNNIINPVINNFFGTDLAILRNIALPIGLSFHTFQAMSYTIEVYRGKQKAERHFGIYALYVMFYPQLVAGPIERPQNVLHQFHEKHYFDYDRLVSGLKLMLVGLFKKVVIADRLSLYVDSIYGNVEQHSGISLIVATVFFAIQIYCDFSAYSEMAIGAARTMGFELMTNFKRPYFSKNISEFWRRWHISLSTWFTDYLYISLGGSRVSVPKWFFNLFFVFLVSGFWHGANWTFIVWGAINGFYLVAAIIINKQKQRLKELLGIKRKVFSSPFLHIITTFLLSCFAWLFFRANSLSDAFIIIRKIFNLKGSLYISSPVEMAYCILGIALLISMEVKNEYFPNSFSLLYNDSPIIRNFSSAIILIIIFLIGANGGQFIYFQF